MISKKSAKHMQREVARTRTIALELEQKGYEIIREPTRGNLPQFLENYSYIPDLLAFSDAENLVVEVKSRPSIRDEYQISDIADRVNREPNWRFLFVYSNPRRKVERLSEYEDFESHHLIEHLRETKLQIKKLTSPADHRAYLLYLWGLFEASLRLAMPSPLEEGVASNSYSLVRNARIEGLLSAEQFDELKHMQKQRNQISHGYFETNISPMDLKKLASLAEAVLREPITEAL